MICIAFLFFPVVPQLVQQCFTLLGSLWVPFVSWCAWASLWWSIRRTHAPLLYIPVFCTYNMKLLHRCMYRKWQKLCSTKLSQILKHKSLLTFALLTSNIVSNGKRKNTVFSTFCPVNHKTFVPQKFYRLQYIYVNVYKMCVVYYCTCICAVCAHALWFVASP